MEHALFAVLAVCALVAGVVAGGPRGAAGGDDSDRIRGEWACSAAVVDGKPLADKTVARLKLTITADRYKTERDDEVLFDSTYQLDPARSPKWIEMIATEGDQAGRPALGIYALEGDTLKICYTMPGGERPKDFDSAAGSGRFSVTWRRKK